MFLHQYSWLLSASTSLFVITMVASTCLPIPFYKLGYGTGRQQVHNLEVDPIRMGSAYMEMDIQYFNMTDPLLADCAGFWFLDQVYAPEAISLYEKAQIGTGFWCSGSQTMRQVFDGISITEESGWMSTVSFECIDGMWKANGLLHPGNGVQMIECNTMAQQYGPCTAQ